MWTCSSNPDTRPDTRPEPTITDQLEAVPTFASLVWHAPLRRSNLQVAIPNRAALEAAALAERGEPAQSKHTEE